MVRKTKLNKNEDFLDEMKNAVKEIVETESNENISGDSDMDENKNELLNDSDVKSSSEFENNEPEIDSSDETEYHEDDSKNVEEKEEVQNNGKEKKNIRNTYESMMGYIWNGQNYDLV